MSDGEITSVSTLAPPIAGRSNTPSLFAAGSMIRLVIDWRGRSFTAEQHRDCTLKPGDSVTLDVRPDRCAWVAA